MSLSNKYKREFSRDRIKRRLNERAAEVWGYKISDLEAFDPMIDLLFGACAFEFERTATELFSSQARILDNLAGMLLPEIQTSAQPAHGICYAQPVDEQFKAKYGDHFVAEKEFVDPKDLESVTKRNVRFSPITETKLVNGRIALLVHGNHIYAKPSPTFKDEWIEALPNKRLPHNELWLGLELKAKTQLEGLTLFFDWKNQANKQNLLNLLPLTKVQQQDKLLVSRSGIATPIELQDDLLANTLTNPRVQLEQRIAKHYQKYFITITQTIDTSAEIRETLPQALQGMFPSDGLAEIDGKYVWLKLTLPEAIPESAFANMVCAINAFPVANRYFHKGTRPYLLKKGLNILPIQLDDFFLGVEGVYGPKKKPYLQIPFRRYQEQEPGTFSVRSGGLGRFDSRQASEMITNLIELMRDESASFKVFGEQVLGKELKDVELSLNRIEQHLSRQPKQGEVIHYLLINATKEEDAWLDYWTTYGDFGNKIPTGTKLKAEESSAFVPDSVQLLTQTQGGRDRLKETERVHQLRNNLLAGERMQTQEQLKAKIMAQYHAHTDEVELKQAYQPHHDPRKGFVKVWEVRVRGEVVEV